MRVYRCAPLALLLAACATEPPPAPVPVPQDDLPVVVEAKPTPAPIRSQPLKYLNGRNLKPIPDRALNVKTKCRFHDVSGGRGSMDLLVTSAEVKRFFAEVSVPKQGMCRFEMRNFQQTSRLPNVVLTDSESGCVVRMWEQGKGVTVAFNACQAKCSGDAFSYLWPIFVDTRNGHCS